MNRDEPINLGPGQWNHIRLMVQMNFFNLPTTSKTKENFTKICKKYYDIIKRQTR